MAKPTGCLGKAYDLPDLQATNALYRDWAKGYEEELVAQNGYVTPERCARVLQNSGVSTEAPILDLGCGTGLAGLALKTLGFSTIDGLDFSSEMLEQARKKDGLYRHLDRVDLSNPIAPPAPPYSGAVAAGVISIGHAPAVAISHALDVLETGGVLVFSLNDAALKDPSFEEQVREIVEARAGDIIHKEYGDHIPGKGMGALVYGLKKL